MLCKRDSVGSHHSRTVRTYCQVSFRVRCKEVASTFPSARVIRDEAGRSRGYGIVSFETPDKASIAMHAMNGAWLGGGPVRVRFHESKALPPLPSAFFQNDDQPSPPPQDLTGPTIPPFLPPVTLIGRLNLRCGGKGVVAEGKWQMGCSDVSGS